MKQNGVYKLTGVHAQGAGSTYKRKIAIVANTTWNIHNFRLPIIRALEAAGHRVVVLAPIDEHIAYLNQLKRTAHVPLRHLARKGLNPLQDIRLFWELWHIYKTEKPDLILHYTIKPNIYGNLAAAICNIPSICVVTGLGYSFIHKGWIKTVSRWLYRLSFKKAAKVVFENSEDANLFVTEGICQPKQAVAMKGCGVNTQFFRPLFPRKKAEKLVFTFIGRLLYDKGIAEFITAAKKVKAQFPQADFWVVGELDPDNPAAVNEHQLSKWIENQDIKYIGKVQDVRPVVQDSHIVVLPSYREGMPRVILEALAMGKPVITTQTAGCAETVEEGQNGFLVPVGDAQALAQAMIRYCVMPEDARQTMGYRSRDKALAEFDETLIVAQFNTLMGAYI